MGLQAANGRQKGPLAKVQVDSMTGLLPRYLPVVSNSNAEADEGDDMKLGSSGDSRWTVPQLFFACSLLSFLFASGSAAGLGWGYAMTLRGLQHCPGPGDPAADQATKAASGRRLAGGPVAAAAATVGSGPAEDGSCFSAMLRLHGTQHPFEDITGVKGHILPPMYGKVREKTIWSYWYDPVDCPTSHSCRMPAFIELCAASIRKNKGTFDFHIVHMDTARNYVSMMELPLRWHHLQPVRQKEALMNALLARYGGVALDLSTVLLRPLDDWWTELAIHKATFMGYMYRVNGLPWGQPEAAAPWFLMSRREGIFSTAVRNQVVNYCDAYRFPDLALGDHTLTPVLGSINSTLPSCSEDQSVWDRGACPQTMQPRPAGRDSSIIPPRTDRKILLKDPRDGPHLPFANLDSFGMGAWRTSNTSSLSGLPREWSSPSQCWQKVVLPRYNSGSLVFVKLFRHGGALALRSRKELLEDKSTFFQGWLKLAGVDNLDGHLESNNVHARNDEHGHKIGDEKTD